MIPQLVTSPETRTHVTIDAFGGPEVLRVARREPLPEPGPGEVRIRVEASSVQFTDTIVRRGRYPNAGSAPLVPGYDLVGRIDAIGEGASGWVLGDRVADLTLIGANATHAVRPAAGLVRVPEAVDAAEAVSLVLSGVTAWQMLFRHARIQAGDKVLIQGGSGAVGRFAVQLAAGAGAQVWTTARPEHHAALRALGAHPVDYRDPAWPEQVRAASGGGVDVAFDGQGHDEFRETLAALRRRGRLVTIGASGAINSGRSMVWAVVRALLRNLNPFGPRVGTYSITTMRGRHPAWLGEDLAALFSRLEAGTIDVAVARRIGFDEVAEAHTDLERGGLRGKIVLLP